MDKEPLIRRSAGMRGDPRDAMPEHRPISTIAKAHPEAPQPARVSASIYAKPKVLIGEVTAPRGTETGPDIARRREALRAFMTAHRLVPSRWSRDAGVPMGELLSFLTGRSRELSVPTTQKLAQAAGVAPDKLFRA
jgi:hypothetical protein